MAERGQAWRTRGPLVSRVPDVRPRPEPHALADQRRPRNRAPLERAPS